MNGPFKRVYHHSYHVRIIIILHFNNKCCAQLSFFLLPIMLMVVAIQCVSGQSAADGLTERFSKLLFLSDQSPVIFYQTEI